MKPFQPTIRQYKKEKMRVFKDFKIHLSEEQLARIQQLKTEIAIDNYATSLIVKHLDSVDAR